MTILEQKINLMPSIEIMKNEDDEFFILDEVNSRHFRINEDTASILEYIQTKPVTGNEILSKLQNEYSGNNQNLEQMLQNFLLHLQQQGVIEDHIQQNQQHKRRQSKMIKPLLKLKLTTEVSFLKLTRNPSFLGNSKRQLILSFSLIFLISSIIVGFALNKSGQSNQTYAITSILYVLPIAFLHLILHEFSHVIVCKKMGGRVKEMGFGLLYYFLPVAFVTYKDAYRLSKLSRAKIAIIGPMFDLTAISITSICIITLDAYMGILIPLLFMQLSFLLFNLNLLLPSDVYRFLESLSPGYNVRGRAFRYVLSLVTGKKSESLSSFYPKTIKTKVLYFIYTFTSLAYIVFLFIFMSSLVNGLLGIGGMNG